MYICGLIKNDMLLAIDIGNTKIKTAVFEQDKQLFKSIFDKNEALENFKNIFIKYPKIEVSISSSVGFVQNNVFDFINEKSFFITVDRDFSFPFVNFYETPATLGVDRMVLVAGASLIYPKKNILVIDAGTCVTYDFLDKENKYFGGAIAPGLEMRYKALHTFTHKLPLLNNKMPDNIIGKSTSEAIYSGVVHGLLFEIQGFINSYDTNYEDLTIILTGGDAEFLAKSLKNTIFANSNFLLESLNVLYHYHKNIK